MSAALKPAAGEKSPWGKKMAGFEKPEFLQHNRGLPGFRAVCYFVQSEVLSFSILFCLQILDEVSFPPF